MVEKRVLVVDDSETVRQQVAGALENAGFSVTQATDGIDALEQIGRTSFSAVVLDVNMPRLNGLEMLERLMSDPKHDAELPLLVLTTEVQPSMIQRAKKAGARAWMVKPVKLEQLVSAVTKLAR